MKDTTRSAISSPMATPKTTSTVRLPRCPSVKPKEMTAAIGAKKGCSLPSTRAASKYATLAATDVWMTGQTLVLRRPAPAMRRGQILWKKLVSLVALMLVRFWRTSPFVRSGALMITRNTTGLPLPAPAQTPIGLGTPFRPAGDRVGVILRDVSCGLHE